MKKVLLEAVLVGLVGAVLAFAANALSPYGLKLNRNYFPGDTPGKIEPVGPRAATGTNQTTGAAGKSLREKLNEKGLSLVDNAKMVELFHDPRYAQNLVVFIDARGGEDYEKGHIPGAHQFDHFHFEKYLTTIVPLCQGAQQIVVYCGGGDCELSENAALMLGNDLGVPKEKLSVYGGGMNEWREKLLPVESGPTKSGVIQEK